MTDEELSISDVTLIARLRNTPNWMREGFQNWKDNVRTYDTAPFEAAARIEQLVATNEALTEQLAAARQDAEEAEAYAWQLEEELRDTQDRANAFATKEYYTEMRAERAEAKLAKAMEALDMIASITVHSGGEIHGVTAQHWRTAFEVAQDEATITLAKIKGESHD